MVEDKILHVCLDEKFNKIIIQQFNECDPGKNQFLIVTEGKQLLFPLDKNWGNVLTCSMNEAKGKIYEYKYLIFHSLKRSNAQLAAIILPNQVAAWFSWGGDIIVPLQIQMDNLEPLSKEYWLQKRTSESRHTVKQNIYKFFQRFFPSLRSWYFTLRTGELLPEVALRKAYSKVKFFSTVLSSEIEFVKKVIQRQNLKYLEYTYGDIEILTNNVQIEGLGNGVLIGHSGFLENNQIDVFPLLKGYAEKESFKLLLNYGDPYDKEAIKNESLKNFQHRIEIVEEFMNTEDFIRFLGGCKVLILNTIQQQAVGILYLSLFFGLKVYLNPKGMLYQHCRSLGLHVYAIEESASFDFSHLVSDLKEKNKKIILSILGKSTIKAETENVINTLLSTR